MTDYFGNQPPANQPTYPYQGQPANNQQPNPYQGQQQGPYGNQQPGSYAGPPSNPFPATSYPQSPPAGTPQPTSSFPSYYTGSQPAFTPRPARPRNTARIVLIVAAVLMFAAAGVFAGFYIAANSDHDKASSVLQDKKSDLADVKKNVSAAEGDKSSATEHNSDLETQNAALKPCIDATEHFIWELPTGTPDAEVSAAIQAMRDSCK
jgi:flagellar basal body-associated protein FliL